MNTATDIRIDAFRQTVERAAALHRQLETLAITIARADELPGLPQRSGDGMQARWLREEQAAVGHPLALRIRHSQLESELRLIRLGVDEQLRAALDAAGHLVTTAAGGPTAAQALPVARINLEQLGLHRVPPATASTAARLALLRTAWRDIDAAMASLGEIRFDARHGIPLAEPPGR